MEVLTNVSSPQQLPAESESESGRWVTTQRRLLIVWLIMGVLPFCLQTRSYLQFVKPHKIPEVLVVPPDLPKETANLTEVCPVMALVLAGVWWNFEATHYYKADQGIVCHAVVPQYNSHGNYFIGRSRTTPYHTTPSSCANDSYPFEQYLYHGSIGYYSFYEGEVGTYCAKSKTAYIVVEVLGSYDINGSFLAKDTGSTNTRGSYWYIIIGKYAAVCPRCDELPKGCDPRVDRGRNHGRLVSYRRPRWLESPSPVRFARV
uniref:Uncharacterized protein n=2 Tax=Phytophthora fragariae TaxID=53985 RepID=A0A6A3ERG9_9STRA|nr:hypothetical protein PF009_g14068 [Phytophthora fragariae]